MSSKKAPQSYTRFIPQAIIVPPGTWHTVYYDEEKKEHFVSRVDLLALVQEKTYHIHTTTPIKDSEDDWDIAGLEYTLGDGWVVANESHNYCGLLPPEMTLLDWERQGDCHH